MLKKEKLNNINLLNEIITELDIYKLATSCNVNIRNESNIDVCEYIIEMYAYLYKHNELVPKLFIDSNPFMRAKILADLVIKRSSNKTIGQAINEYIKNTK